MVSLLVPRSPGPRNSHSFTLLPPEVPTQEPCSGSAPSPSAQPPFLPEAFSCSHPFIPPPEWRSRERPREETERPREASARVGADAQRGQDWWVETTEKRQTEPHTEPPGRARLLESTGDTESRMKLPGRLLPGHSGMKERSESQGLQPLTHTNLGPAHSSLLSRPLPRLLSLLTKPFPLSLVSSLSLQSPNIIVLPHKLL